MTDDFLTIIKLFRIRHFLFLLSMPKIHEYSFLKRSDTCRNDLLLKINFIGKNFLNKFSFTEIILKLRSEK
jgi:hypothetical protein